MPKLKNKLCWCIIYFFNKKWQKIVQSFLWFFLLYLFLQLLQYQNKKKIKRYLFQVNVQISKPYITTSHFFRWCGIMEAVGCILLVKTIVPLISGLPNSLHSANYQICIFFCGTKEVQYCILGVFLFVPHQWSKIKPLDQHKFSRKPT